jgi:hypothetical protein
MNFLKENISPILAIITILLCFLVLFIGMKSQICDENRDVIMLILGGILTTLTTIIGYHFGSSQGSTDKSVTIAKSLNNECNDRRKKK